MEHGFILWSDTWDLTDGRYTLNGFQKLITCHDPEALTRIIRGLDLSVIPNGGSLHLFRDGVEPVYDHPANAAGGHFKMQATSVQAAGDVWALLAEYFLAGLLPRCAGVNGVTYMRTLNTRGLKLWMRDSLDKAAVRELRLFLQSLQNNQADFVNLKFCPHKYILKTLQSQQKALTASSKSVDQRRATAFPSVDQEAAAAPPAAPAPPPSWPLQPVRHVAVYPDDAPASDGAAAQSTPAGPAGASYATAATPAGLCGVPSFFALATPDSPTPAWLLFTQPPYQQQQLKHGSSSIDPDPPVSHVTPFPSRAPGHLPYLPQGVW
eukprot:EG_transcript_3831